jgi:hypothetical protein
MVLLRFKSTVGLIKGRSAHSAAGDEFCEKKNLVYQACYSVDKRALQTDLQTDGARQNKGSPTASSDRSNAKQVTPNRLILHCRVGYLTVIWEKWGTPYSLVN